MNVEWNTKPNGEIVIEQHGPQSARWIAGGVLGLFAAFFAYGTITALQEGLALGFSPGEALVGASVNLVLTLALGIGALLMLLMQARVIIQPQARELVAVRDFRLFQRNTRHPFGDVLHVELRDESKRSSGKMRYQYTINVLLKNRQTVWIDTEPEEEDARTVGKRTAETLGARLQEIRQDEAPEDEGAEES